jgi:TP901 family phage tail tape measure protein
MVGVTAPLALAGGAAVKFATQLNEGMANVATLIPGATDRVKDLRSEVQKTAQVVGKDTQDIASGLFDVISAFGDSADTAKILRINAVAARAGLATTADAIRLTSAVTKAYGDTTAEAIQHVADLAFKTNELGQTTFPEMASAIGQVTGTANNMGVSMETLFGVMATGTGVTGTASQVATQLRGALVALDAPSADLAKLYNHLGVESGKAAIAQFGLQGAFQKIIQAANATGAPLQSFIGSVEGQQLALALAGSQADVFRKKVAAMGNVQDSVAKAFMEQTQGINAFGSRS